MKHEEIFLFTAVAAAFSHRLRTRQRRKDAAADGSYKVTDEHGTITTFKQAPQKVLTLALSSDGIVMGLGMEDKLVAVNYLADDPVSSNLVEQAKKIQHKIKNPSAEEVLALKPDVVFAYDWSDMNRVENCAIWA